MIASPADEHRPVHLEEHVAENFRAADAVVHVNPHRAHTYSSRVVNEVITDLVPAIGVVASGINRADVARFQGDVVNLVKLDHMIVSPKENRAVRMILNDVM